MTDNPLGRRLPSDFIHVERYGLAPAAPVSVERTLKLPPFRVQYDQKQEGSCVGYGWSWAMSILNRLDTNHAKGLSHFPRYDAEWLYHQAQAVDEYADTPPAEGTSVRAGGDVLRTQGDIRVWRGKDQAVDLANGINENRWATQVDQIREQIAGGVPVVLGINWYENFDRPVSWGGKFWIGRGELGKIRGGHCICAYAASDKKQAVKLVNNWGKGYPLVWMPYETVQRLLNEDGEAAVIVDRS